VFPAVTTYAAGLPIAVWRLSKLQFADLPSLHGTLPADTAINAGMEGGFASGHRQEPTAAVNGPVGWQHTVDGPPARRGAVTLLRPEYALLELAFDGSNFRSPRPARQPLRRRLLPATPLRPQARRQCQTGQIELGDGHRLPLAARYKHLERRRRSSF